MNKDYLPYYDSLKDDDKEFWLNCSKEQLIDHIVSNIRNGETLLSRIDKAIEYLDAIKGEDFSTRSQYGYILVDYNRLVSILMGEPRFTNEKGE